MSLPQFGYSYPSAATSLASSQLLMPSSPPVTSPSAPPGGGTGSTGTGPGASPGGGGSTGCCEGGRILGTNPHTGQPLCSCQYSPGLLTYSRVAAGLSDTVYPPSPYTTPGYVPFGTDPSAFYPPLTSAYDLKEAGETWRGIGQPAACYPYDPTGMPTYPYSNAYGAMDINSAARRKNATRENTNTLKAWLYEHRKNPYPTKGEKIMLAIITKMTLTQVSTWFANARRRLKKENKMTWSPRNRSGDADDDGNGDDDDDDDEGKSKDDDDEESEDKEEKKDKTKEENGFCKDEKDCALGSSHPPDTIVQAKRLFEEGTHSPLTSHNLAPQPHPHTHPSLQPPQPSVMQHHHRSQPPPPPPPPQPQQQQQQQQHSPHDGGHFLGITSPSSSQPFAGLTSPEAVGLSSPLDSGKRPDSLCSNSNDSGLSDVNCNFSAEAQAAAASAGLDASGGFRPKIWSLAHVATSDNSSSPYLNSAPPSIGSVSGTRAGPPGMLTSRSPGMENKPMPSLPSSMQSWNPSPSLYSGTPSRPGSFGMNHMNMNHHHKNSLPTPMFSHPALSGMSPGLPPSNGGYTQLSSFYPQSKLPVD